jgi:hypothetical protein
MSKTIYMDDIYKMIELLPDNGMNATTEEGECIYTNIYGEHCIAGEIIRMLGLDLPEVDDYDNRLPVRTLIEVRYEDKFDEDAVLMLAVGQSTADKLTHNQDSLAWGFAKRDMINYFRKTRKVEIDQRNLQAGH